MSSNAELARYVATFATLVLWTAGAIAQDGVPKRKPGLWEMTMALPGRAGATMTSRDCVDERSEERGRRRALDDAQDARCEQRNLKRSADVVEFDFVCASSKGKTEGHVKLKGDMSTRYSMESKARFDPPRGGMSEAQMSLQGQWLGACPADMKPGEMRMTGLPGAPGDPASRPRRAGRERQPPSAEQMQKLQELVEQTKQQRGSKP